MLSRKLKGLTISIIFEAESTNYGEGIGNVTTLKKISRGTGESYSYLSRQAIRHDIIHQMGLDNTPLVDAEVIQFADETSIKDYPEIDYFGYFKTSFKTITRSAVVRLSNAVSLESFNADIDFLTNKGLLDRYNETHDVKKDGGSIAQSEIHKSYYAYTITIDLDLIGIDKDVEISNEEKAKRVKEFLDVVKFLYRDIKGRRENLSPLFVIGGVYDIKNPVFENRLNVKNNMLIVETIESVLNLDERIQENTSCGLIKGKFNNDKEIESKLKSVGVGKFFNNLKTKVDEYYTDNKQVKR